MKTRSLTTTITLDSPVPVAQPVQGPANPAALWRRLTPVYAGMKPSEAIRLHWAPLQDLTVNATRLVFDRLQAGSVPADRFFWVPYASYFLTWPHSRFVEDPESHAPYFALRQQLMHCRQQVDLAAYRQRLHELRRQTREKFARGCYEV